MRGRKHEGGFAAARKVFASSGGVLGTARAIRMGVHPRVLYAMRDAGAVVAISRGLFRLAERGDFSDPDLALVALKAPRGALCLVSALAFHGLTAQIPHEIYLALPAHAKAPLLDHPPVRVFYYDPATFDQGLETHARDGIKVRVYGVERTIVDCFKFRNKIGLDVALEALTAYCKRKQTHMDKLAEFARACRVQRVMQPYLEAVLA